MPPLSRWERTMPSLLDRLIENGSPDKPSDSGDSFISPQRYLESVRRDLNWLLKTEVTSAAEVYLSRASSGWGETDKEREQLQEDASPCLADFPMASASVLAYGIPAQRGERGLRSVGLELVKAVEKAIRNFEPRIDPATLRVRLATNSEGTLEESSVSTLGFEIEGDVRMKPVPEHLLLKAFFMPALAQWRIEG